MILIGMFLGCAQESYVTPESDIYWEEDRWNGSLTFRAQDCSSVYGLEGEERDCSDCLLEVRFALSSLGEECMFSDLEVLYFRISQEQEWLVLEESGWELWGNAEEQDDLWNLRSTFRFYANNESSIQ